MEPYLLDLSTLPDGGASILDLDDGGEPAVLPFIDIRWDGSHVTVMPPGWACGSRLITLNAGAIDRVTMILDCRRPSIQAHLCGWLAWRITGKATPCLLRIEGDEVYLTDGGERCDGDVALWIKGTGTGCASDCPALATITDVPSAIVALVRAHATPTPTASAPDHSR